MMICRCKFLFTIFLCILIINSCKREKYGNLVLHFSHTVDSQPVQFDQLIYTNAAGNQYQVNEVKYFISNFYLIDSEGEFEKIYKNDGIHYVDCSLPQTLNWNINKIRHKKYTAISFIFGLNENDNISNSFVNPPESNFSWPEVLGGGYHYLQINGKFLNKNNEISNLNIHTGIGQIKDENNVIFVHNYIFITLPIVFSIEENQTTFLTLNMDIQRWFDTPNLYNFDDFSNGIMQNQYAQQLLKENGKNVFEFILNSSEAPN